MKNNKLYSEIYDEFRKYNSIDGMQNLVDEYCKWRTAYEVEKQREIKWHLKRGIKIYEMQILQLIYDANKNKQK